MLSIIIVNYKTPQLVYQCLRSVYTETTQIPFEVIVVDNDSRDNCRELIMPDFPAVRWIGMTYNAGFARANNEGIRQSAGNVVLLLNSDTLVEDRALEHCYSSFIQSEYVACGVQLLNPDRTSQISGNYFFKGGLNVLLPLPFLGKFYKWLGETVKMKKANLPEATGLEEVDWINGAYLMVKKEAIRKAGLLDEDFFLYAEETEWCSRLRKQGKLCLFGQYNIIHLQGESSNATFGSTGKGYYNLFDRKGLQIMVSNFLRISKQFGTGWLLLNLANYIAEVPLFYVGSFFQQLLEGKNPFGQFRLATGFAGNVLRLCALVPKMIRNKPYFYKLL